MPSISVFDTEHIQPALELWQGSEHIGLNAKDDNPISMAAFLHRNPGLSFVALEANRLVGAALCGHDGRRGYIYHLAVDASHRRSNLGSSLLNQCLDGLRSLGITKCHAFVFRNNPYAELFWQPQGWERRDDLLVFSRFLSSDA